MLFIINEYKSYQVSRLYLLLIIRVSQYCTVIIEMIISGAVPLSDAYTKPTQPGVLHCKRYNYFPPHNL